MILGLSHITLIAKDLERAALFFTSIFDAKEVYSSGENPFSLSREKFFLINDLWICVMEGEPLLERSYHHIAFQIPDGEFDRYHERIEAIGAEIKPGRPRVEGEGRSLYFYDFDGHLFELHTGTLSERLARYHNDAEPQ